MFRRLLPTIVALGLGLAVFAVGLGALVRIFAQERDAAHESLAAHRDAVAQYAGAAFRDILHRELERVDPSIDRARDDFLVSDKGLLLFEGGEQVLPRLDGFREGSGSPARKLYETVLEGTQRVQVDDTPWSVRIRLGMDLRDAIARHDRPAIEKTFRALLVHRAAYVVPAEEDLPVTIALLDFLLAHETPDPRLMAGVLRSGFSDSHAGTVDGLQIGLLKARARFTSGDFAFLSSRVTVLSDSARVPHDDFSARLFGTPPGHAVEPPHEGLPALINGWYVESRPKGVLHGVMVIVEDVLVRVRHEMLSRALIREGDEVRFEQPLPKQISIAEIRPAIASPEWANGETAIARRFWLKAGLVAVCGLLAMGLVALALLDQLRRQRYLQLKSDFIATVSHELKTPLASLRLMTETLENRVSGIEGARDYPARMLRDIDHLTFLVENILSFNRLDKGRWAPRFGDLALSNALPAIETEIASFSRAPVKLQADGLDEAAVHADPELLRLLFANLTRNACQYNTREAVEIRVEASRTDRLRVRFSDNGVGVPAAERERIFGEFYRGETATPGARGSGLGLALCRRIMRLHDGTIRVASTSPSGTTFELVFP